MASEAGFLQIRIDRCATPLLVFTPFDELRAGGIVHWSWQQPCVTSTRTWRAAAM
jgi:hypothetical protein